MRASRPLYYIVALCVFLCTFILGFVAGSFSSHGSTKEQRKLVDELKFTPVEQEVTEESAPTLQKIASQTQGDSQFVRKHALHKLLIDADTEVLELYLLESNSLRDSDFSREAQERIIQRWSVFDPTRALNLVIEEFPAERKSSLLQLVFREWSRLDLAEAIKSAQGLDQELLDSVIDSMVISREELSKEQRRTIARQLGQEWRAIEILSQETSDSIITAPAEEWKEFVSVPHEELHNLSDAQLRLLGYIAHAWVVRDGIAVMGAFHDELPSNVSFLETTEFIAHRLMESHPDQAVELVVYVSGLDYDLGYKDLALDLIGTWAATSLKLALDATLTIQNRSLQWELQKRALESAAQTDADTLLSSLDSLPVHLRDRAHTLALVAQAQESPESVAELVRDISKFHERKLVMEAVVKNWAKTEISSVLGWIDTIPNPVSTRDRFKEQAFLALLDSDWRRAFQTARSLPLNSEGAGWEGVVVGWLANRNSDLAESLLDKVRPGPGRIEAFDGVIFNSMREKDPDRAIEFFLRMCELEEHADQSKWLGPLVLNLPDLVFASIDKIESSRARVEVADWLLFEYGERNVFSTEELKRIRQIANSKQK